MSWTAKRCDASTSLVDGRGMEPFHRCFGRALARPPAHEDRHCHGRVHARTSNRSASPGWPSLAAGTDRAVVRTAGCLPDRVRVERSRPGSQRSTHRPPRRCLPTTVTSDIRTASPRLTVVRRGPLRCRATKAPGCLSLLRARMCWWATVNQQDGVLGQVPRHLVPEILPVTARGGTSRGEAAKPADAGESS